MARQQALTSACCCSSETVSTFVSSCCLCLTNCWAWASPAGKASAQQLVEHNQRESGEAVYCPKGANLACKGDWLLAPTVTDNKRL